MSEKRDNFEDLMSEFRRRFSDEAGSRSDFRDLVADMMDAQNLSQHGNKIIANRTEEHANLTSDGPGSSVELRIQMSEFHCA